MQNNVTELSQKLQQSLDSNYNVVDMSTVVEIITALEKTSVTKELLETTRLGKYINELRRRTSNESLAKRAKDLLKKWRGLILPDANGQIKRSESPQSTRGAKKRASRTPESKNSKRATLNGTRELDFSDNSNCSIKELKKTDVIFINSDSNSSVPDQTTESPLEDCAPKKRGRKKGSKNHKNLVIAAEESFSNKMAVSRNSKVKTTQELLADLQNRTTTPKNSSAQDIELRAAQLTESLSRIDQKLNPQKQINKNVTPIKNSGKPTPHRTLNENWSRTSTPEIVSIQSDDELVDVVGEEPPRVASPVPTSPLTVEGLLAKLPPLDTSLPVSLSPVPPCLCVAVTGGDVLEGSEACLARVYLKDTYEAPLEPVLVNREKLPNVNGNYGVPSENYQRYSISEPTEEGGGAGGSVGGSPRSNCDRTEECVFREWHETVDVRSYNQELLRILPYVVID